MYFCKSILVSSLAMFASSAIAQTVSVETVDVLYGNKVYRGQHQVVRSSPEEVAIIPAEKPQPDTTINMVVSASANKSSYLEESALAKREQEIYDEVNRRTRDALFTVLFTGNIPEEIQQRRLNMMPEVGIFGDQLDKLNADQQALNPEESVEPSEGEFTEVTPGNRVFGEPAPQVAPESPPNQAEMTDEQKLEQLIGG